MASEKTADQSVFILSQSLERLRTLSFEADTLEPMLNLAAIVALRLQLGSKRPCLAGFIGCTGTGKSTLFNSLSQSNISTTGWRAHNTRGPVLLSDKTFQRRIEEAEAKTGQLLFPTLLREILQADETSTLGSVEALQWVVSDRHAMPNLILIDLPDINTTRSREERLIALELMPWLDRVIFVVDEETLYHRDYEDPVRISKDLHQTRLCVLNNRGTDKIDLNHRDFKDSMAFFGVDTMYVLPVIQKGEQFTNETEFTRLKFALESPTCAPIKPLQAKLKPYAEKVVQENQFRKRAFQALEDDWESSIRDALARQTPIPLDQILSDEALTVLEHLGLKRFSITSIGKFLKNVANTGSLKRSFTLSFGSRRDSVVNQILQIDKRKLNEIVSGRFRDLEELTTTVLHRQPGHARLLKMAPELRRFHFIMSAEEETRMEKAVQQFESRCHELLDSDTLANSIQNDPLVAAGVIVALFADLMALPGFGSWLLAPSIMKLLPLGKFDTAKRQFHHAIKETIHEGAMERIKPLHPARARLTLSDSDPLLQALKRCSHDSGD